MTIMALAALAIPGAALAQDDPPDTQPAAPTLLPVPPPLTTPVVDEAGAAVFAKAYLIRNSNQLVPGARAVQVDVQACDEVSDLDRFYCLAKARLVQIQRIVIHRRVEVRARRASDDPPNDRRGHRRFERRTIVLFRVRLFACVAVARIVGGPAVTPTVTLPVRDCVRVPLRTPVA